MTNKKPVQACLAAFIFLYFSAPAFGETIARVEGYGTYNKSPIFVVAIGTPKFYIERAMLANIVGVYLANAKFFIRTPDGWVAKEAMPPTRELVAEEKMPWWFRGLPVSAKNNIQSFLWFYSGAFRIYLYDQTKEKAEELALAINNIR